MSNKFFKTLVFCLLYTLCLMGTSACAAPLHADVLAPYTGGIMPYSRDIAMPSRSGKFFVAGIASHHGLAAGMIGRFYDALAANNEIESVILIGPDHFKAGRRAITVCPLPWQVGGIILKNNVHALRLLQRTDCVGTEALPFRLEHSIGLHADFLGRYFPTAEITALMIKNTAALHELGQLVPLLANLMDGKTLLVLSMDFSHEKTREEARLADDKSLESILDFKTESLQGLDIDAPRAAWLFLEILKNKGVVKGEVLERTNSLEIASGPGSLCTSYASVVFK